jgi:hypothetical protein
VTKLYTTESNENAKAASTYGRRLLVGVIDYEGLNSFGKSYDEVSLTPPKWNYRLPFYAFVTNDSSRLARTSNTQQEIVYNENTDIIRCIVYAAFNDDEAINAANDIIIYTSPDGAIYTQFTYDTWNIRTINYATNWQKVNYVVNNIPTGTRYLKIAICKTDGSTTNPQIMRSEIYYNNSTGTDLIKSVDDYNDFSKMYSHTSGLSFATNNANNFSLVTADDNTHAIMDQQISYANSAHINYFAWVDGPKYNLPSVVDLFRSSINKGDMGYCVIVHLSGGESWYDRADRYVSYFKDSSYVKVLNGRP